MTTLEIIRIRIALLISVTLLLILSGCVTTPVTEPLHFQKIESDDEFTETARLPTNANNGSAVECLVHLTQIEDKRNSKESFGSLPYYRKFAESVPEWTKEAFQTLGGGKYQLNLPHENDLKTDPHVTMHVKIHKAYVLHQATTKSANLAISVQYTSKENTSESKLYRGRYTAINWANSAGEIEGAMNEALSDVLEKIEKDLNQHCSS